MNEDDTALREAFQQLKDHDRAHTPSFVRVRARAEAALRARRRLRVVGVVVTGGVLALVGLLAARVHVPQAWAALPPATEPLGFLTHAPSAPVTSSSRLHDLERSW